MGKTGQDRHRGVTVEPIGVVDLGNPVAGLWKTLTEMSSVGISAGFTPPPSAILETPVILPDPLDHRRAQIKSKRGLSPLSDGKHRADDAAGLLL
jgi:hypothetical protein